MRDTRTVTVPHRAATSTWTSSSNDAHRVVADESDLPGLDAAGECWRSVYAVFVNARSPPKPKPTCDEA